MNEKQLERLLPRIELNLATVRGMLEWFENYFETGRGDCDIEESHRSAADQREEIVYQLQRIRIEVDVALDVAKLREAAATLREKWATYERERDGLATLRYSAEHMFVECLPLQHLEHLAGAVRALLGGMGAEEHELVILERMLRATAVLVERRGIEPTREHDYQTVMHDYLEAAFDDYKHPIHIDANPLKGFEPDGGVIHLGAAIEFKYVNSKKETKRALSGIFEDTAGYSGSKDWTRFYSVIYQTRPFVSEGVIVRAIKRIAGATWTPVVVTGRGQRTTS